MPVSSNSQRVIHAFTHLGWSKPNRHAFNPVRGGSSLFTSSGAYPANQPTDRSEKDDSPHINSSEGRPVASTSRVTAAGAEENLVDANTAPSQRNFNGATRSSSGPAGISSGERERGGRRTPHDRIGRTRTHPFISMVLGLCGKHSAFMIEPSEPIDGPSIRQREKFNPVTSNNGFSHFWAMQHEGGSVSTPALFPRGGQQESAETKVAEPNSSESEEIERLRQELAELKERFEARSRDQAVSSGFVDIADTSSDTDVIRVLQRLNAEIQQHATHMADCLVQAFEFRDTATEMTTEQVSLVQKVSDQTGQGLAKALGSRPQDVPLLLHIAFQAHLAATLGQTASAWTLDQKKNSFISGIYQTLRGEEAQATSGRWRSLARHHNVNDGLDDSESLVETLVSDLSNMVLVAGCNAAQSDVRSMISSKFKERIALLVELAVRLNKIFDEVVSSDFEVCLVTPGDEFESDDMDETDGSQGDGSLVLCTTHLGLIKQVPEGTLWEKGKKQRKMVLKPRVLLESLLDAEG